MGILRGRLDSRGAEARTSTFRALGAYVMEPLTGAPQSTIWGKPHALLQWGNVRKHGPPHQAASHNRTLAASTSVTSFLPLFKKCNMLQRITSTSINKKQRIWKLPLFCAALVRLISQDRRACSKGPCSQAGSTHLMQDV